MAVLDAAARAAVWADWMRRNLETCAATKPEVRQLIDAMDDYLEANATTINQAIPAGVRNKFTAGQKALAMAFVALRRYG